MFQRNIPISAILAVAVIPFFLRQSTLSNGSSAEVKHSKTENLLLGDWEVISIKASGDKNSLFSHLFSQVEVMIVSKEAKFHKVTIPSRILIETKDGRVLTLDYELLLSKKPFGIDLIFKIHGPAQTFPGIFMLDGDTLQLCLGPPKGDRPTSFELKKEADRILLILKRKQEKENRREEKD